MSSRWAQIQPSYGKPTSLTQYALTVNHSLKKIDKLAYNLIQLFSALDNKVEQEMNTSLIIPLKTDSITGGGFDAKKIFFTYLLR